MKVKDIIEHLQQLAPLSYQEEYDNSGLIVGNREGELKGVLISLDITEETVQEAVEKGCNLIVSHHPIIFRGLKKLTGANYVERTVMSAIKNDVSLYAIHTNLDNVSNGVNKKIADKLELQNTRVLARKTGLLSKLQFYVPETHTEQVKSALFAAGAGNIGQYSECSFSAAGVGTFKAGDKANPFVGEKGERHHESEQKVEMVFPTHKTKEVVGALLGAHPYEEVAYDLIPLANKHSLVGSGMVGELKSPKELDVFLKEVRKTFGCGVIKHTKGLSKEVKRIAVCGGSGIFLLKDAIATGADVFITSDVKYHEFFDAENKIVIADIGHYESEQFTKELIFSILTEKFPTFALHLSEINTNPVNYL